MGGVIRQNAGPVPQHVQVAVANGLVSPSLLSLPSYPPSILVTWQQLVNLAQSMHRLVVAQDVSFTVPHSHNMEWFVCSKTLLVLLQQNNSQSRNMPPMQARMRLEQINSTIKSTAGQIKLLQSQVNAWVVQNLTGKGQPHGMIQGRGLGMGGDPSKELDFSHLMLNNSQQPPNSSQAQGSRLNQWIKENPQQPPPQGVDKGKSFKRM